MMQEQVGSSEQAEALVNTLQIEGTSLVDTNLSSLSSHDLEQLADLQAELDSINAQDIDSEVEHIEVKPMLDGDIEVTEIGEQEVEIEAEDDIEASDSPDEILPDYKEQSEVIKYENAVPPPLRPLTIAPKPVQGKNMALKTAAVVSAGGGQQIVLIQSPGGTTSTVNLGGQQIKLVSAGGQPVTLPNLQNVQLGSKGVVQLRAVAKSQICTQHTDSTSTVQSQIKTIQKKIIPQNKNILTKVLVGQQGQIINDQGQQIKIVTSSSGESIINTAKTITLAQAQQMGLISSGNVQKIIPQSPNKQTLVVNKPIQAKTIKVVPQVKSPTKILPAPVQLQKIQTKEGMQRVIIKQGNQLKTGVVASSGTTAGTVNQVIRLPAGQTLNTSSAGQIHQIQVPGKGVQYIRFMTATSTASSTTVTPAVSAAAVSAATGGTLQVKTTQQKAQVVPVAGISVNRGKGGTQTQQNIIKVVPLSGAQTRPVAPKPITSTQRLLIPATSSQVKPTQTIATIPASALSQIQGAIIPSGNNLSQIVMLPAQYVQQIQNQSTSISTPKVAVSAKSISQKPALKISPSQAKDTAPSLSALPSPMDTSNSPESSTYTRQMEPNGIRPRKPCNCTKSLCLKLYCDCFANGEFCHLCNCMNCYNNLDKEEERQRAIRNCLERNPNAFRPKIGKGKDSGETTVRKHTKGCNCKRSGCLKNYCECYEAKIACSSNCKCIGCRNIEDSMEKKNVRPLAPMPDSQLQVVPTAKKVQESRDITNFRPLMTIGNKQPSSYITSEVVEATNQCLIAQADEAERNMVGDELASRMILEEFGRSLIQIIECSSQNQST